MRKTFTAFVLVAMLATTAHAQPGNHFAVGAGVGFRHYVNGGFSGKSVAAVPEYHFGLTSHSDRQGLSFGLKGGIGYSQPDRREMIGGFETTTGNLRVVSVMAGAGPSYRTGPLRIGMGVVAGPSFNRFSVDDAARVAYRDRSGATLNSIKVKNSVAVRPDASVWYNLTDRVGLHSSVSYTSNQPIVETTVNGVTTQTRWNTDRWTYKVGLALGVF
jgi:hypothetical protein